MCVCVEIRVRRSGCEMRKAVCVKLYSHRKSFGGVAVLLGEYLAKQFLIMVVQTPLTTQRDVSPVGCHRYGSLFAENSQVRCCWMYKSIHGCTSELTVVLVGP